MSLEHSPPKSSPWLRPPAAGEYLGGAGHDCATFANQGVPSAMIFFRNDHGSHNANEAMDIGDFAQGPAA